MLNDMGSNLAIKTILLTKVSLLIKTILLIKISLTIRTG